MIEGLEHKGDEHKCNVCQTDFTDDEGGMLGYLGILPLAFCPFCFAGICDMVEQMYEPEWEDLTDEEIALIDWESLVTKKDCVRAIEAKVKEKNYEGQD